MTEALVRQGRNSDAATLVEFARRSAPTEDLAAQAYVNVASALLASELGDQKAACDAYSAALELFAEQTLPIELAETRIPFARALRDFGEQDEARRQLELARRAFAEMDADGLVKAIDRDLQELAGEAGLAGPAHSASS
jgi:hypothetical protein